MVKRDLDKLNTLTADKDRTQCQALRTVNSRV